jgi:cell division protein FtsA
MKYVAIDLGSSAIRAMAAEVQENGAVKILGIESLPSDDINHGVVEQSSGASFKIHQVLKLLQNSARLNDIEHISLSVGAKSIKNVNVPVQKFLSNSEIIDNKILDDLLKECEEKVRRPDIVVFDIIPLSYYIDGKRQDEPEGMKALQIQANYNVIYGNSHIQKKLDDCFDRTGKVIEYSTTSLEALSVVVTEEEEREKGCILINFGALTTTLGIYFDGVLQFIQVIPLGGKNITKDIQELGISEENAERIKRLKGCALEYLVENPINVQIPSNTPNQPPVVISTQFLATIIEARLDEIMQLIFDSVEKYRDKIGTGIIMTGNGSRLHHLDVYLNDRTGYNVRQGNHTDWLVQDSDEKFTDISISQLVGTIVMANEYKKEHPEIIQKKKEDKKIKLPPGSGLRNKITNKLLEFFDDDNEMIDQEKKDKVTPDN